MFKKYSKKFKQLLFVFRLRQDLKQLLVSFLPLSVDLSIRSLHTEDKILGLMPKAFYPVHSSSKFLEISC